jgi:uncharacterized protein
MADATAGLRQLHRLLLELRDVREELDRGPRQIRARQSLVEKAEAELAQKRKALAETRAAADRKSLDLRSKEAKIADLRVKLNTASTNREFDILRGQIDADVVANSVLEDEILEVLEGVDRLQTQIGEAERKIEQTRAELARKQDDVAASRPGLEAETLRLESRISEVDTFLTGDARLKYRRLVSAHGADALAPVDGKVCTSCYTSVTPQSRVMLNSGAIVFCSCGRLLYLPDSR